MRIDAEIDLKVGAGTVNEAIIVTTATIMIMSAVAAVTEIILDLTSARPTTEGGASMRVSTATLAPGHGQIAVLNIATAAILVRRFMIAEPDVGDVTLCKTRGARVTARSVAEPGGKASRPTTLILDTAH